MRLNSVLLPTLGRPTMATSGRLRPTSFLDMGITWDSIGWQLKEKVRGDFGSARTVSRGRNSTGYSTGQFQKWIFRADLTGVISNIQSCRPPLKFGGQKAAIDYHGDGGAARRRPEGA